MSDAHRASESAIIDPAYSSSERCPLPLPATVAWCYGEAEWECWQLSALRARVAAGICHVGYPGIFHQATERCWFRQSDGATPDVLLPDDCTSTVSDGVIEIAANAGGLPCIGLADGDPADWRWSDDGTTWRPVVARPGSADQPAHQQEPTRITCRPVATVDGLHDFGCELLGTLICSSQTCPELVVGESPAEAANDDPALHEQHLGMVADGPGRWRSQHELAFRYVRVAGPAVDDLHCAALAHPACYRGAFACDDPLLNDIWMRSAYTLRLCMHHFLLDGIKRDRLPWTGDLAMSMLVNAYVFADAELVRNSITVLGRAGIAASDINGIADYSLWWLIAHEQYQLHEADDAFLRREWSRIAAAMDVLETCVDDHGLLCPRAGTWVFVDWVEVEKHAAVQVLWWWAQISAASLARRIGADQQASAWSAAAQRLAPQLRSQLRLGDSAIWRASAVADAGPSRHATVLALAAGLDAADDACLAFLASDRDPMGTPYMKGFELLALARQGAGEAVLTSLRQYWGGMVAAGATTFWEAYEPSESGDQHWAFYGRPFGRSCCHAWSAGPAAIVPIAIFGLEPLDDGWCRCSCRPQLSGLAWATATVPTPHGPITAHLNHRELRISLPPGIQLELDDECWQGPASISHQLSA